jgi:Cof subfamily protein (haloacid dehalogenase superfamily)
MAPDLLKQIIVHFKDLPVNFAISENGTFYMPFRNDVGQRFSSQDRVPVEIIDFDLYLDSPKPKLHILCHEEDMPKVVERSKSFNHPDAFGVKTDSILFEYIDPRVSKAKGVFKIAELNGLTMEEIMAFGDADNDITMLNEVGVGVAMGNASPLAKAAANHITSDHNHNGIAHFIDAYFA